ncbi:flagellar biosynthetic protein FliO [Litoribrevibacter euphylliae]|uniref:Flagellar protein n=1 Tax=Litoribrevibacter euphylliae TaxID=1834034 RepID=A0ABV7HE95_9GAMM
MNRLSAISLSLAFLFSVNLYAIEESLSDTSAETLVTEAAVSNVQGVDKSSPVETSSIENEASNTPVLDNNNQASPYVQRLVGGQADTDSAQSPTSTTQLAMTVAGLFAVIGMIFVIAWLVRRLSGGQFGHSNAVIKILATQPLGTKERICLIDVGGQQVLVGITAQSMQTLMVLDQPIDLKTEKQSKAWSSAESVNSVFGAKLQSLLKGTSLHEVKKSSVDD